MSILETDEAASTRTDYVVLPDLIRSGRYDAEGRPSTGGRVFIANANTAFVWSVFECQLEPGQIGSMIFRNAPGTFLVGTSFTEWDPEQNVPRISDALLTLRSAERSEGKIRIVGRNTSSRLVVAAAGIIIGDDAPYPEPRR